MARVIDIVRIAAFTDDRGAGVVLRFSIGALVFSLWLDERKRMALGRLLFGDSAVSSVAVGLQPDAFHLPMPRGCREITPDTLNCRQVEPLPERKDS